MPTPRPLCCKCKTEPCTVNIRHAKYCHKCFQSAFIHKFRAILNRSKTLSRKKGKVLLACSGGPSSLAMVHVAKNKFMNFDPIKVKQVPPIPSAVVCHIDESALFEKQAGSAAKLAATCASKVPELSYTSVALQDMFSADFIGDPAFDTVLKKVAGSDEAFLVALTKESSTMSNEERLRALFKSINKNTAKEDLFWHLKLAMLLAMARREGCDYIFLGDTATRQSIKMISCISHGRGYSIPFDVGVEVEGCFPGVVLLRPMKDALTKEVAVYNHLHGLTGDVIAPQNFGTYMPPKSSIERLTEHFIVGLDRDFPSTVSTVSRTASKLTPQKNMDYTKKCAICLMPYEQNLPEWRKHITVTKVGVEAESSSCDAKGDCCGNGGQSGGCGSSSEPTVELSSYLCYSCQVNLKDYTQDTMALMPPAVAQAVADDARQERLRSQIQDFLIDDEE